MRRRYFAVEIVLAAAAMIQVARAIEWWLQREQKRAALALLDDDELNRRLDDGYLTIYTDTDIDTNDDEGRHRG